MRGNRGLHYANNHAYCNFDVYRACIGYLDPFANLGDLAEASIPIGECRRCRKRFRFLDDFIDFILEHLAHKQAQQANTTRQGAKTTLQRNARSTRRRKVVAACGYEVIAALPLRMGLTEGSLSLANLLRHRDFGPRYAAAKKNESQIQSGSDALAVWDNCHRALGISHGGYIAQLKKSKDLAEIMRFLNYGPIL
jgi:hypothetical protein